MTITVESGGKSTTYRVTSNTRFFKNKKPAILGDGEIGERVTGVAKKAKDGTLELITATFGGASSRK